MNTTEDAAPKRRGRPASGKRGTFSFRVTDSLRAKLEAESARTGRPVTEEIEMRLEASFAQPSPHSAPVLALLGATIGFVETMMGETWRDNESVAVEVRAALDEMIMKRVQPDVAATAAERISAALLRASGHGGRAAARFLNGDPVAPGTDSENAALGLISMWRHKAEKDPIFRKKLEDSLK